MCFILFIILSFINREIYPMEKFQLIDLTHKVHEEMPTWDLTCGYHVKILRDYKDCSGEFKFRSQDLIIRASAGTHIDSPAHCFEGARDVSDLSIKELICPCVVVNVSHKAHEKYKVTSADIEEFENNYGTIKPGSFVLFYTGWSKFWHEPEKYHNNLSFPSISAEVAQLLIKKHVAGIGIDTLSPDCDEKGSFVHSILLSANKYIVENIAYDPAMPVVGSYILVAPLKAHGATESPIRLIGMIP